MSATILKDKNNIFLGVICLAICMVFFMVGLWPMNFYPGNEVEWLPDKNGIRFYGRGIAYSPEPFNVQKQNLFPNNSISIELWLQPKTEPNKYTPQIFSFYDGKGVDFLILRQWKSHLEIIRSQLIGKNNIERSKRIGLANALPSGIPRFITITSEKGGTVLYIDGKRIKYYPACTLIDDTTRIYGQLILGNSPTGKQPWNGNIFGLAIYNRSLMEKEVLQNYQNWVKNGSPAVSENKGPIALYLFDERSENLIHNKVGMRYHLFMPVTFQMLKKTVLPWQNFRLSPSYLSDIFINIIGFVPFGFIFPAFLFRATSLAGYRIYIITVLLGSGMSLVIELIQVNLPIRSSSLTDLLCNVAGTTIGVILFQTFHRFIYPSKRD
jgi:hypothetical protein